jgi:hypothetical protein
VIFKQTDEDIPQDATVIKLNPEVAIAMKGFSPYSMSMSVSEGASFSDACKAQGFYPGVSTLTDVLRSSMYDVVSKNDSPAEAATAVAKMFDEARDYCVGMVKALPQKAFKLEALPEDEETADDDKSKGAPADDATKTTKGEGGAATDDKSGGTEDDKKTEGTEGQPAAVQKDDDKKTEPVETKKSDGPDLQKMLNEAMDKLGAGLRDQLGAVQKSVDTVQKEMTSLASRVTEAEAVAKSAQKAVEGTVIGSDAGEDATQVQKSDQGGYAGREIDTGFHDSRQRRRPAR